MATLDDKGTAELLKASGPSDEHRKQFGQSFLGSWLGQTIYLVGMLGV